MFDIRPATQKILFTQFGRPKQGNTSEFVDAGDDVTLRVGMFRVGVKVQHARDAKIFTGVVQEVEPDEVPGFYPKMPALQLGQIIEFSNDMIFACARDA